MSKFVCQNGCTHYISELEARAEAAEAKLAAVGDVVRRMNDCWGGQRTFSGQKFANELAALLRGERK